jgi:L-ascorbate metabolism protein UlaG (beta-lactamase superfamily)
MTSRAWNPGARSYPRADDVQGHDLMSRRVRNECSWTVGGCVPRSLHPVDDGGATGLECVEDRQKSARGVGNECERAEDGFDAARSGKGTDALEHAACACIEHDNVRLAVGCHYNERSAAALAADRDRWERDCDRRAGGGDEQVPTRWHVRDTRPAA